MEKTSSQNSDLVWAREEVASPCVKVCLIHPTVKICTGCYRTIDEISRWTKMSVKERKNVITELPSRAHKLSKRRGGRKSRFHNA